MKYPAIKLGKYQVAFVVDCGPHPFAFYTDETIEYSQKLTMDQATKMVIIPLGRIIEDNELPIDPMDWSEADCFAVEMSLP